MGEKTYINKELQYDVIECTFKQHNIDKGTQEDHLIQPGSTRDTFWRKDMQAETWRKSTNQPGYKGEEEWPRQEHSILKAQKREHDLFMKLKEFQYGWSVKHKGKNGKR